MTMFGLLVGFEAGEWEDDVLYATNLMPQTRFVTTRLDVGGMVTVSTATMPCAMPYSLLLNLPPWAQGRRFRH